MADKLLDSRNKRLRYFKKLHAARCFFFSLAHYRTTSPQGEGVDKASINNCYLFSENIYVRGGVWKYSKIYLDTWVMWLVYCPEHCI